MLELLKHVQERWHVAGMLRQGHLVNKCLSDVMPGLQARAAVPRQSFVTATVSLPG